MDKKRRVNHFQLFTGMKNLPIATSATFFTIFCFTRSLTSVTLYTCNPYTIGSSPLVSPQFSPIKLDNIQSFSLTQDQADNKHTKTIYTIYKGISPSKQTSANSRIQSNIDVWKGMSIVIRIWNQIFFLKDWETDWFLFQLLISDYIKEYRSNVLHEFYLVL